MSRKFLSLLIICIIPMTMFGQTYDSLWKQVEQAQNKSLPQTVIKLTGQIFSKAQTEKNSPQMLKAYTARARYQQQLTPDSFYVDLKGLEQWATTTDNPIDGDILNIVIAGTYAQYARHNMWTVNQRASLIGEIPEDIREWSHNLFVDKVMQHTGTALKDSALLLSTSTRDYRPFVEQYDGSGYFNHDMYHLLTNLAIDALKMVGQDWQLTNEPRLLASTQDGPESKESVSQRIEALYNSLMNAYQQRGNADAYILARLDYLEWKYRSEDSENYIGELDKLISLHPDRGVTTEVYLRKINLLKNKTDYFQALSAADEAISRYPKYNRINAVKNAREDILLPHLSVQMPGQVYPDTDVEVTAYHRNLDGFTVEYYQVNQSVNYSEILLKQYYDFDKEFINKNTKLVKKEQIKLERPADYDVTDTIIRLRTPDEGLYIVRVTTGKEHALGMANKLLSVTRLKMISRLLPDKQYEIAVVDGMSGKPVDQAEVQLYTDKRGERTLAKTLNTNAEGKTTVAWDDKYNYIKAIKGSDNAMLPDYVQRGYYVYSDPTQKKPEVEIKLLTDRTLYRPGQTVYVKGIAYTMDSDTANVAVGKKYTLKLTDPNQREVYTNEFTTNEYGSFTAEIVLPAAGLNGMYSLLTDYGTASIRVEEYKRPTFDITFDKSEDSYRLGDTVNIKGTVKSFSGVFVQDVPVTYTVKRSARNWGIYGVRYGQDLIASGTAQVDDKGQFTFPVELATDKQQKSESVIYAYAIEATVTNVAGETQSSVTTINAGNRSLILSINAAERINKDDSIRVTFAAANLGDQPIEVTGTYGIYQVTDYLKRTTAQTPVYTGTFTSNREMDASEWRSLPSGAYVIKAEANDLQGRKVETESMIVLFSIHDTRPAVEMAIWYHPVNTQFDADNPASFVFGTSLKDAYVFMDVFSGNSRLESKVIHLSDSLIRFDYPYREEYGNGLTINFCFIKEGEAYIKDVRLTKKIADKELKMRWEVFRDKLLPGQQEEWRLIIEDPRGLAAEAEMLATLYDASLDKIWNNEQTIRPYYGIVLPNTGWTSYYASDNYYNLGFQPTRTYKYPNLFFDRFWTQYDVLMIVSDDMALIGGWGQSGIQAKMQTRGLRSAAAPMMANEVVFESEAISVEDSGEPVILAGQQDDIRTNFAETAFFYPQLRTNEKGEIVLSFTMPESLTRWNFRGYAHTKGMLTGMLTSEVVTSKEFMLTPNLPRFVRVGDETSVTASISNTTGRTISGTAVLTLFDPLTDKVITTRKEKFTVDAGRSAGVGFTFQATDEYDFLGCRMVAEGENFSDGEQHILPVLSDKERVTETVAMPIRGNETRKFSLESIFNNNSRTATDRRLTVEFTGNPAWYAIQALPSIALPESDNAISWATAFYANNLAAYIMNAQPRIKAVFETWKLQGGSKDNFLSNLQKNQDVKNILLEESPWLLEATTEAEQMQRIGILFDLNRISNNNIAALTKLNNLQLVNGAWTWYKGMNGSRYITTYILETLVRLYDLTGTSPGREVDNMRNNAFKFLHQEALSEYRQIREAEKRGSKFTGISGAALEYLYLLSISGEIVPDNNQEAYKYFLNKLPETLATQSVKEKAQSAIILNSAGKKAKANEYMASLKEHLVKTDEQGMYFAFNESSYRWNDLRIPAHVSVMEAFDRVANDNATVEEMKIWLLKQKQTQQWDSPVASTNAVYALLHRGSNLLESQGDVRININGKILETLSSGQGGLPGTGYIKQSYTDKKMVNNAKSVTVEKRDAGIAWGAVYAQYSEQIDKVTQHGSELNVDKKLYIEQVEGSDRQLIPITTDTKLKVGDRVVSRISITLDRAMDFVQLKDQRGACFEPIGALSGYSFNNGLGYYVDVKDASTNFFFDSLGKGVYVLEYSYRVSRSGTYQAGLAVMQSAYAPEYSSHSASMKVIVE